MEKLKNYRPTEKEPFMNERQRDYFRAKLLVWKEEILRESRITLQTLQEENVNHPDLADRASSETDRAIELRAGLSLARLLRERGRKAEARDVLAPIYAAFTEGFERPDLTAAKALLAELN